MTEATNKPVVLLATQSLHSSKSISKLLSNHFEVIQVADVENTWKHLIKKPGITVLICDLAQAVDQFGLLERLRNAADKRLAAKPVLLLVREQDAENDREQAFQQGATDFINTPFSSTELTTRVRLHANLFVQHSFDENPDLQKISVVDVLQQLAQEKFFYSRLRQELGFSMRHKVDVSACKLKVDKLDEVITKYDKQVANAIIEQVAGVMQDIIRAEDSLCYLGNGEFYILYPATNGIGATVGINRISKELVNVRLLPGDKPFPVTLSGAIYSNLVNEGTTVEGIVEWLDKGLTIALSKGGNNIESTQYRGELRNPSVDVALKLIESGDTDGLSKHAPGLMLSVMPLLEYSEDVLKLGLGSVNPALRERINRRCAKSKSELEGFI